MRVGIDLGTTYSAIAKYDRKSSKAVIIPNRFGKELTPSVICFLENETLIGEDAKDMQAGGAGVNAASFKRGMGDPGFSVEAYGRAYSAEDLSTLLLRELIKEAEESSKEKIDEAVIAVPAYFNDLQRKSTIRAGEACGIRVPKIVNEPTAAAIAYGYRHSADKTILVYDLGGGTFDVTVVRVSEGLIDVLGTAGNHVLGGKDWDAVLMDCACGRFSDEFGEDPRDDPTATSELIVSCEEYKKVLTKSDEAAVSIRLNGNTGRYTITRKEFEMRTEHLLSATKDVIAKLLDELDIRPEEISEVLLCGGSTRMPQVPEFLGKLLNREVIAHTDTDLAVARGAAIAAELYCGSDTRVRDVVISDVTAHSLGALSVSPDGTRFVNEIMIEKNSKVPATVTKPFAIKEGNITDRVEVYTLQGESPVPLDCVVLGKDVITGFQNGGAGLIVDIGYSYDDSGVVHVTAAQNGSPLDVQHQDAPGDVSWMDGTPAEHALHAPVSKSIVMCVDLSRSMSESMDEVRDALTDFATRLADGSTRMALIGFGDRVKVYQNLTGDWDRVRDAIGDLRVKDAGRGTDASPLDAARSLLSGARGAKVIVVLTDGIWGNRDQAVEEAMECRSERIYIAAVGFSWADRSFLKQIATVEEGALFTTLNNLGAAFSTIASTICRSSGLRERGAAGLVEHGNRGILER
ncbi:Hsp70 family protein [Methanomassiliicoccaceae archaeon COG_1]|nr:Hsp70 family protein [Methanomassiliicoccaceae archaeon COG_1]